MDLFAFHKAVIRNINARISSIRSQAPAAKMVGEFAVKYAKDEVEKKLKPQASSNPPQDPSASDN